MTRVRTYGSVHIQYTMITYRDCEKLLKFHCRIVGLRIDGTPEPNKYFKAGMLFLDVLVAITFLMLIHSCFYINNLLDLIVQMQVLILAAVGIYLKYMLKSNKVVLIEILEWVRNLYTPDDILTQRSITKIFPLVPKYGVIALRFAEVLCFFGFLFIIILGSVVALINSNDEEYGLPIMIHYGYLRPTTWWKYLICLVHQYSMGTLLILWYNGAMALAYIIFLHLIMKFNALIYVVNQAETSIAEVGFDVWLKVVALTICEMRTVLNMVLNLTETFFYIMEKFIYASVFTSLLIIKIEKGSLLLSIGTSAVIFGAFVLVCINEIISDKVSGYQYINTVNFNENFNDCSCSFQIIVRRSIILSGTA